MPSEPIPHAGGPAPRRLRAPRSGVWRAEWPIPVIPSNALTGGHGRAAGHSW
jgi:hypothetical protein